MCGLPLPETLLPIIECFFDTINVWFPILQYSSITCLLEAYDELSQEDEVLLHAITIATLRLVPTHLLSDSQRASQRAISLRRVKLYVLEHMSIRTLQTLVILSIDAFGTDRMPGLLMLLRRQFDILSASRSSSSPAADCSTPGSIFSDQTMDTATLDSDSLASIGRVILLLERFCFLITTSRSDSVSGQRLRENSLLQVLPSDQFLEEEQVDVLARSRALDVLAQVFSFGQYSFATPRAATQTSWRKTYASLHQRMEQSTKLAARTSSRVQVGSSGFARDSLTEQTVYLA